jgi:hypothetical protein
VNDLNYCHAGHTDAKATRNAMLRLPLPVKIDVESI